MMTFLLATGVLTAASARAQTIEGVVSGAVCGIHEMKCDHKPGAHGYETLGIFVDGKGFFYFANVPQKVLRRINRMEITVKGEVKPKYRSILAHVIKADGKVVWVWKKEMKGGKHMDKGEK